MTLIDGDAPGADLDLPLGRPAQAPGASSAPNAEGFARHLRQARRALADAGSAGGGALQGSTPTAQGAGDAVPELGKAVSAAAVQTRSAAPGRGWATAAAEDRPATDAGAGDSEGVQGDGSAASPLVRRVSTQDRRRNAERDEDAPATASAKPEGQAGGATLQAQTESLPAGREREEATPHQSTASAWTPPPAGEPLGILSVQFAADGVGLTLADLTLSPEGGLSIVLATVEDSPLRDLHRAESETDDLRRRLEARGATLSELQMDGARIAVSGVEG